MIRKSRTAGLSIVALLALASLYSRTPGLAAASESASHPSPALSAQLDLWRAARFGMFIHWGPVALKGTEIGWSRGAEIPVEEYDNLYKQFNPTNFNADQWMQVARDAGMKYVVFTTKHHDGFCMFNTRQTDFNVMRSPFGRDVVKELAAAARQQGLAFGTYHSVCDWHHPDFPLTSPGGKVRRPASNLDRYEQYLRAQVSELITNYGPLLVMWFDVPQEFDARRGQGLIDWARSFQPNLIVNNRSGAPGDYDTPEQRVGKFQMNRPWETCMTICQQWAWKPNDTMKSLKQCLQTLVLCAGGDGNLLFNVGPTPDGKIEQRQIDRLREMGQWLARYGETVYGTRGGPWMPSKTMASTRTGKTVYLHLFGFKGGTLTLPNLPLQVINSALLTGGNVTVKQEGDKLLVSVPAADCQEIDTILKLELTGSAMDIKPIATSSGLLATASNVFQRMDEFGAEMAFDDDSDTRWATDAGTRAAWVALDLGKPQRIQRVRIREAYAGRVVKFEFQVRENGGWKTIFPGTILGENFSRTFPAVTAREIRLNILESTEGPTLWEIAVE